MNTIKEAATAMINNRIKEKIIRSSHEGKLPSVSKDIYVHCDGAITKSLNNDNTVFSLRPTLTAPHKNTALSTAKSDTKSVRTKASSKILSKADHTPLSQITSKRAVVWLQKLDKNKLAVQWNVPHNIQRNCQDLLLNGDKAGFVLRLYQNVAVGNAQWKTSQRTLEYPIDILRRKCYINLENKGGGKFTAEIGVRSANGRYIFIARSEKCSTARFSPESPDNKFKYQSTHFNSPKKEIKTPKVFKNKGRISVKELSNTDINTRDIIAESLVSGLYTDFLREGPKTLRRINEHITPSSIPARAEFLNALKAIDESGQKPQALKRAKLLSKRLDPQKAVQEEYNNTPVMNHVDKSAGYIPQHLGAKEINGTGVMIASMLNTAGTVAIDVFKKGENKNLQGIGREVVKVKSKKDLAKAMKKSGIREKSELILKGKLEPGRRVRVGGLLIDTETDGSFYVSCSIKNGKLHVPVEEIEAIIVE